MSLLFNLYEPIEPFFWCIIGLSDTGLYCKTVKIKSYNHVLCQLISQYKENKQLNFYAPVESIFFQPPLFSCFQTEKWLLVFAPDEQRKKGPVWKSLQCLQWTVND